MKTKLFFILLVGVFMGYGQQAYYNDVDLTKTGIELRDELALKIETTHTRFLSYTPGIWEASRITDEDPGNKDNVILIYGYENGTDADVTNDISRNKNNNGGDNGEWNREHTYARSLGTPNLGLEGPGADAHHLRPSDVERNSNRSNRKFADGSGNSAITAQGNWYPGDEWKGDIARMMLYMYLRYGDRALPSNITIGATNTIDANMIDLLLEWNAEDPVSRIEKNRNNYHNSTETYAQGNRNPFIDNPNLATKIWGGAIAEDLWNTTTSDVEIPTSPSNLVADVIGYDKITISWTSSTDNIEVIRYDIFVDGNYVTSTPNTTTDIISLAPETSYNIEVFAIDLSENISLASNSLNVATISVPNFLINENFNDCATVTNNFTTISESSTLDWRCDTDAGQDSSGGYQMNAFSSGSTVPSIDWLITTNPINFDATENESLNFYTRSEFGNTALQLLFSSEYDGNGNPSDFIWTPVPNIVIPSHPSGNGSSDINTFADVDISSITGTAYIAFKYDTDGGNATRWTVDNFQIIGENILTIDEQYANTFFIFPNPSHGRIFINTESNWKELLLYDLKGSLLKKEINNASNQITLENLPKGILLLEIIAPSGQNFIQKIVVD